MKTLHLNWEDFVDQYNAKKIRVKVDLPKAHQLLRSGALPSRWKFSVRIMRGITLLTAVGAAALFVLVSWWGGLAAGILALMFRSTSRREISRAVIETARQQPMFYGRALASNTLTLRSVK